MVHMGYIQVVQQQVCDAQHIGKLLLFNTVNRPAVFFGILRGFDLRFQPLKPARNKAAGAASEIRHTLADPGADHLCHKIR